MPRFEDDVYSALRRASPDDPVGVVHILEAVDARQRMVLERDELNAALAALIVRGTAQQVRLGAYAAGRGSQAFVPIEQDDFDAAVREYQASFAGATVAEVDDDGTLVKLCFDTTNRSPSEAALDEFTDALEDRIGDIADVLGFEFGPGVIELHILVEEGASAESVAAACAEAAAAWEAIDGHRVEIIRSSGS